MRSISLTTSRTTATLATAGALTLGGMTVGAPAAHAAVSGDENNITSFGFSVKPSTVAAGGKVTLKVDGCDHKAIVSSGVFDTVTIPKGRGSARAQVDWDAKPGAMYTVTFDCNGEKGTTDLTIKTGRGHTGGGHTGGMQSGGMHSGGAVHKGVKAGIGGTFGGLDLGELGLGAALIAGALGSAYYWARRRPTEDDA